MANTTENPDRGLCPTWAFLNNCNVHVARDRGWFKTYTPWTSRINATPLGVGSHYLPVLGIGTVEIPTKRSPNMSGVSSHGSFLLHDVLHVPDILCNVIGMPDEFHQKYKMNFYHSKKSRGSIQDMQGRNVAYFDPKVPLLTIKVRGPPSGPKLGPHTLEQGVTYMLGCRWEFTEEQRWLDTKAGNSLTQPRVSETGADNTPPYTDAEKAFLKDKFGSEYRFLLLHGLKIHKEDDRAEGRIILRALMSHDESESESDFDSQELEDDASNFIGHQADYNFTESQLEWIEKHYSNSENFMVCYGLKFYKDEDLEEAITIVDAMMDDDDEEDY